ncbi:MAG: outer membrane beta-barrel protein [Verrucomicrobiota bacterium]
MLRPLGRYFLLLFVLVSGSICWAGDDYIEDGKDFEGDLEVSPDLLPQNNPFTFSITVREEYDDNTNTSEFDRQDSFKTWITPSIVFTYPMDNTIISAGLTYSAIFFLDTPSERINQEVNFVIGFNHTFNDRVNLDVRNRFSLSQEPDAIDDIGVFEVDGTRIVNTTSVQLGVEWTPLFGTTTTYDLSYYAYDNSGLANTSDRIFQSINQDFRFLIWPTVTLVFGGGFSDTDYFDETIARDFQNIRGNAGVDWQALPNLVMGARAGVTVTSTDFRSDVVNPTGSAYVNWEIGARSSLSFRFVQSVTNTDIAFEQAQVASTFFLTFNYQFTPRLSGALSTVARLGSFDDFVSPGAPVNDFSEDIASVSFNLSYAISRNWSANAGYTYSTRISPLAGRDYYRNRVWLGLTATF